MAITNLADLTTQFASLQALVNDLRNDGLTSVQFETGVESGDCVYLDTGTNTFRRCLANSPETPAREKFHGVANFPEGEENFVRIYSFDSSDDYKIYDESDPVNYPQGRPIQAFIPGAYIYISTVAAGGYTQTANDSPVGVAVGIDRFLLASELDNASGAVRQLITDALEQTIVAYDSSFRDDDKVYITLKARLDALLSTILESDETVSELDDEINVTTDEVITARGSEASLNARISVEANRITGINNLLDIAAGTMADIAVRLAVSINDDGTLKTTISASTYTTETEEATYVSTTSFTLPIDLTGVYEPGRSLRINDTIIAHVLSSVFTTETLVTVVTSVIPTPINKLEYSFSPAELPLMAHSQLAVIETVEPSSDDTARSKHVSDNDIKTLQDQIDESDIAITAVEAANTSQDIVIAANTAKVGITTQQAADITANNAKISFDSTSSTKLGTIAEGAEVNVTPWEDWVTMPETSDWENKQPTVNIAEYRRSSDLKQIQVRGKITTLQALANLQIIVFPVGYRTAVDQSYPMSAAGVGGLLNSIHLFADDSAGGLFLIANAAITVGTDIWMNATIALA